MRDEASARARVSAAANANASTAGGVLGNSAQGPGIDNLADASGIYINANLYVANESAELVSVTAWVVGRADRVVNYKAAIYADTASGPSLIASSAQRAATASGWLVLPLTAKVTATKGARYWLAIWSNDIHAGVAASGGGASGGLRWQKLGFANAWPATLQFSGSSDLRYSIYAGKAATTEPPDPGTPPPSGTLRGWQLTTGNVGLAPHGLSCGQLPLYAGPSKPAAGSVIRGVRVTVPLDLSNGNILVEKSCIKPNATGYHNGFLVTTTICARDDCWATPAGNVVIRDSEIDAEHLPASSIAGSCAFLGVGTLQRNHLHGMGSGICFFETGTVHSARAEQNYVRGLRSWGDPAGSGSHNEAATIRDFRNASGRKVEFINNRLDCSGGNETGALFIQPTWLPIHNVYIEGNYFEGGGFNLYLERTPNASYGNVNAADNRFRPTGWGAAATPSGPGYTTWRDNHLYDATKPDAKGAVVNP